MLKMLRLMFRYFEGKRKSEEVEKEEVLGQQSLIPLQPFC